MRNKEIQSQLEKTNLADFSEYGFEFSGVFEPQIKVKTRGLFFEYGYVQ